MQSVDLICVGKLKEAFYKDAAQEYQKRLGGYCKLNMIELAEEKLPRNPSQGEITRALEKEGRAILEKLPQKCFVVALCVEGRPYSSDALAQLLQQTAHSGDNHIVFVIGGSYGMDDAVKRRANVRLSISPMTFPHHMVRVMLLEQVYRGFKILEGSSYHK